MIPWLFRQSSWWIMKSFNFTPVFEDFYALCPILVFPQSIFWYLLWSTLHEGLFCASPGSPSSVLSPFSMIFKPWKKLNYFHFFFAATKWYSTESYCCIASFGPLCFMTQSISVLFDLNASFTSDTLSSYNTNSAAHGAWWRGGRSCFLQHSRKGFSTCLWWWQLLRSRSVFVDHFLHRHHYHQESLISSFLIYLLFPFLINLRLLVCCWLRVVRMDILPCF